MPTDGQDHGRCGRRSSAAVASLPQIIRPCVLAGGARPRDARSEVAPRRPDQRWLGDAGEVMASLVFPSTPVEPATETIGGITFEDPYRWLEDDTDWTIAWQTAQNAAALDRITAWPGYQVLREQIEPYVRDGFIAAPRHCGGNWFSLRFADSGPQLMVASQPGDADRVLFDAAAIDDASGPASLDWFYPSPDGRYVAYGISFNGDEQSVMHIVEADTGRVLDDRIQFMSAAIVSWMPDSRSLWCNAGLAPDFENADKYLFFHRIGQATQSPPEKLTVREQYSVFPQVSADGRY